MRVSPLASGRVKESNAYFSIPKSGDGCGGDISLSCLGYALRQRRHLADLSCGSAAACDELFDGFNRK